MRFKPGFSPQKTCWWGFNRDFTNNQFWDPKIKLPPFLGLKMKSNSILTGINWGYLWESDFILGGY